MEERVFEFMEPTGDGGAESIISGGDGYVAGFLVYFRKKPDAFVIDSFFYFTGVPQC